MSSEGESPRGTSSSEEEQERPVEVHPHRRSRKRKPTATLEPCSKKPMLTRKQRLLDWEEEEDRQRLLCSSSPLSTASSSSSKSPFRPWDHEPKASRKSPPPLPLYPLWPGSLVQDEERSPSSKPKQQRSYKSMTRERRMEANARERTRVHTISAAFESLRGVIPTYSNNNKLSKLSILRIACSYILALSRLAGLDYSKDASRPSFADCVDAVAKTIQTEGKLK